MKIKTMAGVGTLVFVGALLIPLYTTYGVIGYIIASVLSLLVACFCYFAAGIMDERRAELQSATVQTQNAVQDSIRQLTEQHERFVSYSDSVQAKLLQAAEDMKAFQQGSLQQLEGAKNEMISIAIDQQAQAKRVTEQLGEFTSRIVNLFEVRLTEEFESIQATKIMTGETLTALRTEVAQSEDRQAMYLSKLETTYTAIAGQLAVNQKEWTTYLNKHMSEMKLAIADTLDDTKTVVEDILKSQRRDAREVLGEIQENQESVLSELSAQGKLQQNNLEVLQRLQEEILDLNQQDMKLISKLMQKV
ncbi:hypothetical protein [Paenibacillus sp. FSL R5-0912]|uniref:hypothetical protein n=1 Tax=Paenibacillus sp. FSL R5-0912 TaxID=1536771 RepID=UPI0004F5B1FD|nr:hypothetical protein [Paenibacillus sp. FSL R5-0912]AIQ39926.1 hypothetical protein R50912_07715 [Paenibacillus sp. FSL R5-0912]